MKNYKTELKFAVIYTIMTISWAALGKALGFHSYRISGSLIYNTLILIPSLLIYYLAIREKRKSVYQDQITFKQGLMSGLVLTVFVTLLGPLTPLITVKVISPDFFENSIKYVTASGMMTESEANEQFSLKTFIIQGLLAAPIFGLIFSAIAAILTRKKTTDGK